MWRERADPRRAIPLDSQAVLRSLQYTRMEAKANQDSTEREGKGGGGGGGGGVWGC